MAFRPTNPGWGAAATVAKRRNPPKPPAPPPPEIGSAAWFASAPTDVIAAWVASQEPDYSDVNTDIDFDRLASIAQERTDKVFGAARAPYDELLARNESRRQASTESATNFAGAMANILMGGKTGDEGMAYAKEQWGGSYMGALALQQGEQLRNQIAWDFDARDMQLGEKIADLMAKRPDFYESIMGDLVKGETDRIENGLKLADSTFEHRVKAYGALLLQRYRSETLAERAKDRTQREKANQRSNLTKLIQQKMRETGVKLQTKSFGKGGVGLFNPETGEWSVIQEPAVTPDKPVKPIRVKANGQWFLIDPLTGARLGEVDVPAETSTTKGKTTADFYKVRKNALAMAKELFKREQRPTQQEAFKALMDAWGQELLGKGHKPKTVEKMIYNVLRAAAAGGKWAPSAGSSYAAPDRGVPSRTAPSGSDYQWGR